MCWSLRSPKRIPRANAHLILVEANRQLHRSLRRHSGSVLDVSSAALVNRVVKVQLTSAAELAGGAAKRGFALFVDLGRVVFGAS